MKSFSLPSGPLGWIVLALAATVGLFLVFWLMTTLWILALAGGFAGSLAYVWRRLQHKLHPNRWRRLPMKWR